MEKEKKATVKKTTAAGAADKKAVERKTAVKKEAPTAKALKAVKAPAAGRTEKAAGKPKKSAPDASISAKKIKTAKTEKTARIGSTAPKKPRAGKATKTVVPEATAKGRADAGAGPTPSQTGFRTGYVSLIGRPNAGKSTLVNALIGEKVSIVSDKPQTTRISILGIKTTEHGQIIFVDNPGIHKPLHGLNRRMMNFVFSSIETADAICLLIDATQPFGHGDEFALETLRRTTKPVFLLINKVDIMPKGKLLPIIDNYKERFPFKEIIPISAMKGVNLDVLEDLLYRQLPEAAKLYSDDEISDQTDRFLYAELVREKVLRRVTEELPFSTAVLVDSIEHKVEPDRKKAGETRPISVIMASIFVEKDNQRKIIIGRHGSRIKEIGIDARRDIEEIIGHKVFLALHVKVKEDWRDAEDVLNLIEGQ